MVFFKNVVDQIFTPAIDEQVSILNHHLKKRGLRAGVDLRWFVDRIEKKS